MSKYTEIENPVPDANVLSSVICGAQLFWVDGEKGTRVRSRTGICRLDFVCRARDDYKSSACHSHL